MRTTNRRERRYDTATLRNRRPWPFLIRQGAD
jgi:hypothetical protein